jgi:hypothetical protein
MIERVMDDDLEAIVSIPWELEGEIFSSNIAEELAFNILNMKKPSRIFSLIILKLPLLG